MAKSEKNNWLEKYKIYSVEYQHQDKQMWNINLFFFSVHAGLFVLFFKLLESESCYLKGVSVLVSIIGIIFSIFWLIAVNKNKNYIFKRLDSLKKIEKDNQDTPKIWTEEYVRGTSVKWIYTLAVQLCALLGWILAILFFFIQFVRFT